MLVVEQHHYWTSHYTKLQSDCISTTMAACMRVDGGALSPQSPSAISLEVTSGNPVCPVEAVVHHHTPLLAICSVTLRWQPEVSRGRYIYPTEIGRHYKAGFFPTPVQSWWLSLLPLLAQDHAMKSPAHWHPGSQQDLVQRASDHSPSWRNMTPFPYVLPPMSLSPFPPHPTNVQVFLYQQLATAHLLSTPHALC